MPETDISQEDEKAGEAIFLAMGMLSLWTAMIRSGALTKWQAMEAVEESLRNLEDIRVSALIPLGAANHARNRSLAVFSFIETFQSTAHIYKVTDD